MKYLDPSGLVRLEDLPATEVKVAKPTTLSGKPLIRCGGKVSHRFPVPDLGWLWRMLDRGKLPLGCMFKR